MAATQSSCDPAFWALLGVTLLALVISLVVNVIYCTAAPHKAPALKYKRKIKRTLSSVSLEIEEIDDTPIYGNVVQDSVEDQNESCYESMTPASKAAADNKVGENSQMCYASLDLSGERKKWCRKMENKASCDELDPPVEDNLPLKSNTLRSRTSIYLNSDQLVFSGATNEEEEEEENIHADPIKLYSIINASRSGMPIDGDLETGFDNPPDDFHEY